MVFYYSTILCWSQSLYGKEVHEESSKVLLLCFCSRFLYTTFRYGEKRPSVRTCFDCIMKGHFTGYGKSVKLFFKWFHNVFLNIILEQTITLTRGHNTSSFKVHSIHFYWQYWYFAKFIQIWLDKLVVSNGNTVWY